MVFECEASFAGYLPLEVLKRLIKKLYYLPTLRADEVVMVAAAVYLIALDIIIDGDLMHQSRLLKK